MTFLPIVFRFRVRSQNRKRLEKVSSAASCGWLSRWILIIETSSAFVSEVFELEPVSFKA